MLNIPSEISEYIREFAHGKPKDNYKLVISELKKKYCHPTCNYNCLYKVRFIKGKFIRNKIFISQCYIRCKICNSKVSKNDHSVCHSCSYLNTNPIEFCYHHKICQ